MKISVATENCDAEIWSLIEESANSRIILRIEVERIASVQSRNDVKAAVRDEIQSELSKFTWIIAGSVNVELCWYLNGTERQETDKVGDLDNITKPIIDSLLGLRGVLFDDSQIGSIHTFWMFRNEAVDFTVLNLTIELNNDSCMPKKDLWFVQYTGPMCLPLTIDLSNPKGMLLPLVLLHARKRHRVAAGRIKALGFNADRMLTYSNWDFHRTRLGAFDRASVLSLSQLRTKVCEKGFTWAVLRSLWKENVRGQHGSRNDHIHFYVNRRGEDSMIPVYPDLEWCSSTSERKGISARCPHATVHRCHRYFESASLLSDQGITTKLSKVLHDQLLEKWTAHELWPVNAEGATSISGGEVPNCFANFCPEVAFDTFKLFASTVIRFHDELDSSVRHKALEAEGAHSEKDWRWNYEHVAPMHYSDCPVYSKIPKEKGMPQINIHGNVNGQLNVGGDSVNSPVFQLSLAELVSKIDASAASPTQKAEAKSKLQELLAHPVVAAVVGGLAGKIGA